MGKDKVLGPELGIMLLSAVIFASVYWGAKLASANDAYFYHFVSKMDQTIEDAYGRAFPTESFENAHNR